MGEVPLELGSGSFILVFDEPRFACFAYEAGNSEHILALVAQTEALAQTLIAHGLILRVHQASVPVEGIEAFALLHAIVSVARIEGYRCAKFLAACHLRCSHAAHLACFHGTIPAGAAFLAEVHLPEQPHKAIVARFRLGVQDAFHGDEAGAGVAELKPVVVDAH